VYYMCTKHNEPTCKNQITREEAIIEQLANLMDTIELDEIAMKEKIKEEVQRIKRFQSSLLGKKDYITTTDIDIRNYAKYILRDGKIEEKRELLGRLKSAISIDNKVIRFASIK